jgi:hypothetical protein
MKALRIATAGGTLCLLLGAASLARLGGQGGDLVGYLAKDRLVELATAVDGSVASFTPSPTALASFVALVDPVHVRMFLLASRPEDLRFAAAIIKAVDATGNTALSAEFIGVSKDLDEPAGPIAENGVTETPELIVYWMGAEIGRMRPLAGSVVEEELATLIYQARAQIAQEMLLDNEFFRYTFHSDLPLDCTRCHLRQGAESSKRPAE